MFWLIVLFLVVLWVAGLIVNIGGSLIHLLLLIAAIILIFNVMDGRRSRV